MDPNVKVTTGLIHHKWDFSSQIVNYYQYVVINIHFMCHNTTIVLLHHPYWDKRWDISVGPSMRKVKGTWMWCDWDMNHDLTINIGPGPSLEWKSWLAKLIMYLPLTDFITSTLIFGVGVKHTNLYSHITAVH